MPKLKTKRWNFPDPMPSGRRKLCLVCGAKPIHDGQYQQPNGLISMSTDSDLCFSCSIWLWRAVKLGLGDKTRQTVLELMTALPEMLEVDGFVEEMVGDKARELFMKSLVLGSKRVQ